MPTGKKLVDVTVIRYVDDSPRASVEDTKSYVLSQWQGVLRRDREGFVRWCEDENGNVLESHDDFWPPAKPTMWSYSAAIPLICLVIRLSSLSSTSMCSTTGSSSTVLPCA
jgi:hypothetical protein